MPTITLTKKQLHHLLDLVYCGEWMINAIRGDKDGEPRIEKYEVADQLILKSAYEAGMTDMVEKDAESGRYYPTRAFEERKDIEQYRDEYNERTFWDELIDRLAARDLHRMFGEKALRAMPREERMNKLYALLDYYGDECERNGIERFSIVERDDQ